LLLLRQSKRKYKRCEKGERRKGNKVEGKIVTNNSNSSMKKERKKEIDAR